MASCAQVGDRRLAAPSSIRQVSNLPQLLTCRGGAGGFACVSANVQLCWSSHLCEPRFASRIAIKVGIGCIEPMSLSLRQLTQARVGLGRAGNSLPTSELLEFRLAQARARDAVHVTLDVPSLRAELREIGLESLAVSSAARNRTEYLRRPDLGRKLNQESLGELESVLTRVPIAFVIADGLSALAVHRHAPSLLRLVAAELSGSRGIVGPVIIATQGRVAIGDEIGAALGAELSVVLIGERPGLSAPDSLGVYLTYQPKPGRTDAERNCISNIRPEGLSYAAAAFKLLFLVREARRLKLSGVNLKDSTALLM